MRMPLRRLTLFGSASSIRECWWSGSKFCAAWRNLLGDISDNGRVGLHVFCFAGFAMKVLSPATRSCAPSDEDEASLQCLGQADRRGKPQHFPQRAWGSASRESL